MISVSVDGALLGHWCVCVCVQNWGPITKIVNGGTLNILALCISAILESLNFLGPGC